MSWWSDLVDYGNSVDPSGTAGYAIDPISVSNAINDGVLNPDLSINNDYQIPETDIRNQRDLVDYDRSGIGDFLQGMVGGLGSWVVDALNGSSDGSSGSGSLGSSESGLDENLNFRNQQLQRVKDLIDATTRYNNEWSAQQAEIQRNWQAEMSSTAHQREVADLQAAGLNPVLSAGGTGASTPSGAMGQTDTSNTRLIGELAMSAVQGLTGAAVAGSAGATSGGLFNWINRNRGAIGTINNVVRTGISLAKLFA